MSISSPMQNFICRALFKSIGSKWKWIDLYKRKLLMVLLFLLLILCNFDAQNLANKIELANLFEKIGQQQQENLFLEQLTYRIMLGLPTSIVQ
jgi:hypothetical protein